jgi:hypothetical protein
LTVFFHASAAGRCVSATREIDGSSSIVAETAQNPNRANFRLKSKVKKFLSACRSVLKSQKKEVVL